MRLIAIKTLSLSLTHCVTDFVMQKAGGMSQITASATKGALAKNKPSSVANIVTK
jgi:hypothetical protein